jgi:hypothetical protein
MHMKPPPSYTLAFGRNYYESLGNFLLPTIPNIVSENLPEIFLTDFLRHLHVGVACPD